MHRHLAAQRKVGTRALEAEVVAKVDIDVDDRAEAAGRLFFALDATLGLIAGGIGTTHDDHVIAKCGRAVLGQIEQAAVDLELAGNAHAVVVVGNARLARQHQRAIRIGKELQLVGNDGAAQVGVGLAELHAALRAHRAVAAVEHHVLQVDHVLVQRHAHHALGQADALVVQRHLDVLSGQEAADLGRTNRAGKLQAGRKLAIGCNVRAEQVADAFEMRQADGQPACQW